MKKKNIFSILLIICALFVFAGCRHERIPDDVIDTSKMAEIITGIHLIDSYDYVVVKKESDSLWIQTDAAYDSLLCKFGVTKSDYDSSMAYYVRHPKLLEGIYEHVLQNLREMKPTETDTNNNAR